MVMMIRLFFMRVLIVVLGLMWAVFVVPALLLFLLSGNPSWLESNPLDPYVLRFMYEYEREWLKYKRR